MENIPNHPDAHKLRTQVITDFVWGIINRLSNISDYYIFFNTAIDMISKISWSTFYVYPKPITENPDGDTPKDKEILLFHKKLLDYKQRQARKWISTHQVQFTQTDIESRNGIHITLESWYKIWFLEIPWYSDWTERFSQNQYRLKKSIQERVTRTIESWITQCNMMLCLKLAQYDSLTWLYSRGYGRDLMYGNIESQINKKESLGCMIFIDLDNFKKINDQCGHNSWDHVLQSVAQIIKESIKQPSASSYIPVRYGWEELVIYCPGWTTEEVMDFARALRKNIEQHKFELQPQLVDNILKRRVVTASIGVAGLDNLSSTLKTGIIMKDGIEMADMAMYYVKKVCGKNDAHLFDDEVRKYFESENKDSNTRPE